MDMGDTQAHPGHALAAQFGISPEMGVRAWEQVQAAVQAAQQRPTSTGSSAAILGGHRLKKKESPWPKWDGSTGTFLNFRSQLRVKIEEDRHLLGTDRAICYGMLQALPDEKKARAHGWFDRGGLDGTHRWEAFLEEFTALFEDKQARQNAGEQLTRMRQGSCQHFVDFLQDFEYKLQQCGGTNWAGGAKIMQLNASINTPLKSALITVDLPDDDYDQWKTRVSLVAGRLEGLPSYRPKGANHTKTWYTGTSGGSRLARSAEGQKQVHHVDVDGDTMGGVNALAIAIVNAIKGNRAAMNAVQPQPTGLGYARSRAPWRSANAIRRLRDQGLCLRCEQSGHLARNCPTFKGAKRPRTKISATAATPAAAAAVTPRVDPAVEEEGSVEPKRRESPSKDAPREDEALPTDVTEKEVQNALGRMDTTPLLIDCMLNSSFYHEAFVDNGCLCNAAFSSQLAHQRKLPRIAVVPRELQLAEKDTQKRQITHITYADFDIDGRKERVWGYIIKNLAYPIILGKPWMEKNDVVYLARKRAIRFGSRKQGLIVREKGWYEHRAPHSVMSRVAHVKIGAAVMMIGSHFSALVKRSRRDPGVTIGSATIRDINKALEAKKKESPGEIKEKLPERIKQHAPLFADDEGPESLAPHRLGVDTKIELQKDDQGREKEVPWGPLYGMSRDELLVLRKTLTELLDKNWIRASSSPGGAPVLFVRKPGGGLRFCVDYRALNAITQRDRYPLPLIKETLRQVARATWVSKLDVCAAFHRLRIKEGDEWKTAFRTRFGAFEYLVTPFGLAGAPAAFQRWINKVLGEYLGDFCSAYMDDILIYTDGSLDEHWIKLKLVLARLEQAGLKLDLKKCEFAVKQTKYLGFVIKLGEGIQVDPEKVAAIKDWQAPTTVKGVRSFIGFANFYRDFIESFSEIAEPLLILTKKTTNFHWRKAQKEAFEKLKELFITAPILAMWHEDRLTVLEADCSGYNMGGCLSQYDAQGRLRPVAYFSKKLTPAECNYEIHDKELLAIVRGMEEWRGELIGLTQPFVVLSDHKNLQYFMTSRRLSERQVRWSQTLSQFDFRLKFRAGKNSQRPDALSRREQDMPQSGDDDRLKEREFQLLKDQWIKESFRAGTIHSHIGAVKIAPARVGDMDGARTQIPKGQDLFQETELQLLWDQGVERDEDFKKLYLSMRKGERKFPTELDLKVSLSECDLDARGALRFRRRVWVPNWEPLQTALIQKTHDSHITGHPGYPITEFLLARGQHHGTEVH